MVCQCCNWGAWGIAAMSDPSKVQVAVTGLFRFLFYHFWIAYMQQLTSLNLRILSYSPPISEPTTPNPCLVVGDVGGHALFSSGEQRQLCVAMTNPGLVEGLPLGSLCQKVRNGILNLLQLVTLLWIVKIEVTEALTNFLPQEGPYIVVNYFSFEVQRERGILNILWSMYSSIQWSYSLF